MNSTKRKLILSYGAQGFTLIELLIVIVIIAILAGLVIGVLNPIQQQNRARDATVSSSISKLSLGTKSLHVSSPRTTNKAPTLNEFINGVGNLSGALGVNEDCSTHTAANTSTGNQNCTFALQGIDLPAICNATTLYRGDPTTDATQCRFGYARRNTATQSTFRIAGMGAARPQRLFVYEMIENVATGTTTERFLSCLPTQDITIATLPGTCVTQN